MPYSAVTQPLPPLRIHPGTPFSTLVLQSTRVWPSSIRMEPSAVGTNPGVSLRGRIASSARESERRNVSVTVAILFGRCRCISLRMSGAVKLTNANQLHGGEGLMPATFQNGTHFITGGSVGGWLTVM